MHSLEANVSPVGLVSVASQDIVKAVYPQILTLWKGYCHNCHKVAIMAIFHVFLGPDTPNIHGLAYNLARHGYTQHAGRISC